MAICQFVGSGKEVGIYAEMLLKLTFGSQNKKRKVWEILEIASIKVKHFKKFWKFLLLAELPKNPQKISKS